MMKKNGFTLAEVLITLAIIGVVATLTLPALMTNTQEQQARTALKKGINTLTEAAQMSSAIAGFDYASLRTSDTTDQDAQSLYGLLTSRASVDYQLSGKGGGGAANSVDSNTANYVVFFRDGSAITFKPADTLMTNETVKKQQDDGLNYGISVVYDTNGIKGPNLLSNCDGDGAKTLSIKDGEGDKATAYNDSDKTCTKEKRVIRDQFGVRLRGGYAVPNGAAARWAFDN